MMTAVWIILMVVTLVALALLVARRRRWPERLLSFSPTTGPHGVWRKTMA